MVVEVLAPGRRTNQVRVTGTSEDDTTVLASLGATGHPREEGLDGGLERCPQVAGPDDAETVAQHSGRLTATRRSKP